MRLPEALPIILTGDVFSFRRSPTLFGRLIRAVTQSSVSHVGFAIWLQSQAYRRLYICEALEGHGVRLYPMSRCVEECARTGCIVDWHAFDGNAEQRAVIADFCESSVGKRYASPWQFVRSFGLISRWLGRRFGWPVDLDPERFFCSEFVATALAAVGCFPDEPDTPDPAAMAPGWIDLYPCLHHEGALTP